MSEFSETVRTLNWLAEHGALAGVAEVARERRRQIEQLGWTPEHDQRTHGDGSLVVHAWMMARGAQAGVEHRDEGPAYVERKMAKAGALAAAEIDRLTAEFTPGEPVVIRTEAMDHPR